MHVLLVPYLYNTQGSKSTESSTDYQFPNRFVLQNSIIGKKAFLPMTLAGHLLGFLVKLYHIIHQNVLLRLFNHLLVVSKIRKEKNRNN